MFLDEIKCLLEEDHSRKQTNTIVNFVGDDKKKMKALMSFFLIINGSGDLINGRHGLLDISEENIQN